MAQALGGDEKNEWFREISQGAGEGGWDSTELLVAFNTGTQLLVKPHQRVFMNIDPGWEADITEQSNISAFVSMLVEPGQMGTRMPLRVRLYLCRAVGLFWEHPEPFYWDEKTSLVLALPLPLIELYYRKNTCTVSSFHLRVKQRHD